MVLYLVQHGLSNPREKDPQQGLSAAGTATVNRIAAVARGYHVTVGRILHSGKLRARQTAEIFMRALAPRQGLAETDGLNPMDDVTRFIERLDQLENVMLVGHLPFMERLAAFLVTGSPEKRVFKFQNGGILCLEKDGDAGMLWYIKWTLMPEIG
ncbi:MAG: phosphohistidine phosphatase SixA [Desulfobacterales bacterium]